MTRGEMITQFRYDALDPQTVQWTRERVEAHLDAAALYVFIKLQAVAPYTLAHATTTFTSASGTLEYTLSPTNIAFIRQAYETPESNSELKVPLILEGDIIWQKQWQVPYAESGWKAGIRRLASGNQFQIIFDTPGAGDRGFTVEYVAQPSNITTGSGNDSTTYTAIPYQFHGLVVARAVWKACGADRSLTQTMEQDFADQLKIATSCLQYSSAGPRQVRRS